MRGEEGGREGGREGRRERQRDEEGGREVEVGRNKSGGEERIPGTL